MKMDNITMTIGLIYPYDELEEDFLKICHEEGVKVLSEYGAMEQAEEIAIRMVDQVDVFVSRAGTASFIQKSVDIPVVSIPKTPFDNLQALYGARHLSHSFALFSYKEHQIWVKEVEQVLDIEITEYLYTTTQEIEEHVMDAKVKGINVCVGGSMVVELAQKIGLQGILVKCGLTSMMRSLKEAINIVKVSRREREHGAWLNTILESIVEGIVVSDNKGTIKLCNASAEKIFNINSKQIIEKDLSEFDVGVDLNHFSPMIETAEVNEINQKIIACNSIPIVDGEVCLGIVNTFQDITKIRELEENIREKARKKGFVAKYKLKDIISRNTRMKELKELVELYSDTDSSVLIEGESGTGKELFAQSIHNASKRRNNCFIAVNCAAIPEQLLESELFGYDSGAFTGASKEGKQGLFELAHKGTIFLDEIGEISKSLQARLLRVIQEKEIMRVGGSGIIPIDIRIISATNKNLYNKVEVGEFRDDLYYRLNVFNLKIPPLRERKEDIPLLAAYYLKSKGVEEEELELENQLATLMLHDWPGNIRQLFNIMDRVALYIKTGKDKVNYNEIIRKVTHSQYDHEEAMVLRINENQHLKDIVSQVERDVILRMMKKYHDDYQIVSEKLSIGRTTLWRKTKG